MTPARRPHHHLALWAAALLALPWAQGCRDRTNDAADARALDLGQDAAPDALGPLPAPLARLGAADVRVATYNIMADSAFVPGSQAAARFARVVRAVRADIWALQEVYKAGASEVAALFDRLLPLGGGKVWQVRWAGSNMTLSRHAIKSHAHAQVPGSGRWVGQDLIDLPDAVYARDLYLINLHFTCCGGTASDAARQKEADYVVSHLRDARSAGGTLTLPANTPVVLAGDLNTVGGPQPLSTLLTGDIVDEARFGKDAPPDWDGTALTDARPLHNAKGPDDYTWRWDGSGYTPSRLDYVIFSDSAATLKNRFVLNTTTLPAAKLAAAGLYSGDVLKKGTAADAQLAFDHLPVVVDLSIK